MLCGVVTVIALLGLYLTSCYDYARPAVQKVEAELAAKEKREPTINTFDIMLLHEVGKEARKDMNSAGYAEEDKPIFFTTFGQYAFFLLLFVGFAIKVPVFPFH